MIRAGSENPAEDAKDIERRGFTDEPTSKSRVKERKYCEKSNRVEGRGGGKIRWT